VSVISLVQSNIIRSRSSAFKEVIFQKNKARRLLAMVLIFSILLIGFFYILEVNNIASKGYKIRSLKKQIKELKNKNKGLQINISHLKSISNLQLKTENFNMVEAESIEYVTLPPASVVLK